MPRVKVTGRLLGWARERSRLESAQLVRRFPLLEEWERETQQPTLKQLEAFARATFVPIGYLLLPAPPVEEIPIPDFRTMDGLPVARPSANLLDVIYACQLRQDWYRDYARETRQDRLRFVGSMTPQTPIGEAARQITEAMGFSVQARATFSTWEEALRQFLADVDRLGVMAMCSGVL